MTRRWAIALVGTLLLGGSLSACGAPTPAGGGGGGEAGGGEARHLRRTEPQVVDAADRAVPAATIAQRGWTLDLPAGRATFADPQRGVQHVRWDVPPPQINVFVGRTGAAVMLIRRLTLAGDTTSAAGRLPLDASLRCQGCRQDAVVSLQAVSENGRTEQAPEVRLPVEIPEQPHLGDPLVVTVWPGSLFGDMRIRYRYLLE